MYFKHIKSIVFAKKKLHALRKSFNRPLNYVNFSNVRARNTNLNQNIAINYFSRTVQKLPLRTIQNFCSKYSKSNNYIPETLMNAVVLVLFKFLIFSHHTAILYIYTATFIQSASITFLIYTTILPLIFLFKHFL